MPQRIIADVIVCVMSFVIEMYESYRLFSVDICPVNQPSELMEVTQETLLSI